MEVLLGIGFALALIYGPSILYTRAMERRRQRAAEELEDRLSSLNLRFDSLQKQLRELQTTKPQPSAPDLARMPVAPAQAVSSPQPPLPSKPGVPTPPPTLARDRKSVV